MKARMSMKELAARISAHLARFEADPKINAPIQRDTMELLPFYNAGTYYGRGAKIGVRYISYQGHSSLSRDEALAYLEWLDAGNVGKHQDQQRAR